MGQVVGSSVLKGFLGASFLLVFYFTIVTLVSGWNFAQSQFSQFWYFILALSVGFGIQVGLYTYLKNSTKSGNASVKVLAVSGTTSTTAMISCCVHYLVNLLPILGAGALISIISQYQIRLFWVGLAFNLAGIIYMASRVVKYTKAP